MYDVSSVLSVSAVYSITYVWLVFILGHFMFSPTDLYGIHVGSIFFVREA